MDKINVYDKLLKYKHMFKKVNKGD